MPTNEQMRILRQLIEMFGNVPVERITILCEQNKWNIDMCIDELVNEDTDELRYMRNQQRGAIPKMLINTKKAETQIPLITKQDNVSTYNRIKSKPISKQNIIENTKHISSINSVIVETRIFDQIVCGYKVMILMRGAPGSGKTSLANTLLERFVCYDSKCKPSNFILSTDDFWIQSNGRYIFNRDRLSEAHQFNQNRARQKASSGWSPIIIDNTNTMIWEMMPYVEIAVRYSYIVEVLEPNTPWRNSAKILAQKNKHRVPRDSIQNMLDKYEASTAQQLIDMLKRTKYRESIPQYRSNPPIKLLNVQDSHHYKTQTQPPFELKQNRDFPANNKECFKEKKKELHPQKLEDTNECISKHCGEVNVDVNNSFQTITKTTPLLGSGNKNNKYLDKTSFTWAVTDDKEEIKSNNILVEDKGQSFFKSKSYEYDSVTSPSDTDNKLTCSDINYTNKNMYEYDECEYTFDGSGSPDNKNVWNRTSKEKSLSHRKQAGANNIENYSTERSDELSSFGLTRINQFLSLPPPNPVLVTKSSNDIKTNLLTLLQEKPSEVAQESIALPVGPSISFNKLSEKKTFTRHSVDCVNEDPSFVSLRQIYPNKDLAGLWDLFVKCNGGIDWAIDILIRESEMSDVIRGGDDPDFVDDGFICQCKKHGNGIVIRNSNAQIEPSSLTGCYPKPQRQRKNRSNITITPGIMEMKETIENKIVISEEHYTDTMKKLRYKNNDGMISMNDNRKSSRHVGTQTDSNEDDPSDEDNAINLLEVTFNENIVNELNKAFQMELTLGQTMPEIPNMKVFVPRHLAKELYMLWIESVYNFMEEQRQQTIHEDEQFARLLKNPKYQNCKEVPSNLTELLDMEMALMIYNNDREETRNTKEEKYIDLATHLKRMKLSEMFIDIPRETLEDILSTNNNDYSHTVEMLSKMKDNTQMVICEEKNLIERVMRENELLNEEMGNWYKTDGLLKLDVESPRIVKRQLDKTKDIKTIHNNVDEYDSRESSIPPEEAKRLALISFEEARNMAAHHCQLKAECFYKAKEAIQKGNGAVAMFYSEVASLHTKKKDMYNHMAANAIVNVHKYTQNNPDLLDLHYLHVREALSCLDVFLDHHITNLRTLSRPYKHVFVITGRGLHSVRGVSTIKTKVKTRLKDRNLRWSDVNPGLLKIKIFSASRHSKNFT